MEMYEFTMAVKNKLELAQGRPYCDCGGLIGLLAQRNVVAAFDEAVRLVNGGADSWCFLPPVAPNDRPARDAERAALIKSLQDTANVMIRRQQTVTSDTLNRRFPRRPGSVQRQIDGETRVAVLQMWDEILLQAQDCPAVLPNP